MVEKEFSLLPGGRAEFRVNKTILFYDASFLLLIGIFSFFISLYFIPLARDFGNYELYYGSLSNSTQDLAGERFEFGFQFLAKCTSFFFPSNVSALYFIIITASLYIKYWVLLRLSGNKISIATLFLVFYLFSFLLVFEVNQVRAAMAVSFGFAALYAFYRHKIFLTLVLLFLAFSFHYSSIVFSIGIFCMYMVNMNKVKSLFILIVVGCIISKSLITIIENLNPIAAEYAKNYDGASFGITSITFILPMIFFLYHIFNIKKENSLNVSLLMFLFAGLLFSLTMSSIPVYAIRILEMIEVSCLLISINRNFNSLYDYGSFCFAFFVVFHKFIAYVIVNPLFYL